MSVGKQLEKMRVAALKAADRAKLAELRAKLKDARARKRKAMRAAVQQCRRQRVKVAAEVKAWKERERARINAEAKAARERARSRCTRRKCVIKKTGGSLIAQERRMLAEERAYQAQLQRLAGAARKRKLRTAATAKERRAESDDYVRGNLPAELIPVFNRVKGAIKGGPRTTRTEAFLQWAESHPDEILHFQAHDTDREVARLVAEHEALAGKMASGRHYARVSMLPEAPPF